jgi:hypothetical protein
MGFSSRWASIGELNLFELRWVEPLCAGVGVCCWRDKGEARETRSDFV